MARLPYSFLPEIWGFFFFFFFFLGGGRREGRGATCAFILKSGVWSKDSLFFFFPVRKGGGGGGRAAWKGCGRLLLFGDERGLLF